MTGGPPIAVLGAGTMGAGIAQVAAIAGREVILHDPVAGALEAAPAAIARRMERAGVEEAARSEAVARIRLAPELAGIAGAEVVIEAAPERLELKREVLASALAVCGPGVVLASNTSSLLVTEIARGLDAPGRLVGMHFFNPVPRMGLVEVVAGLDSDGDALERAEALAREVGKSPVRVSDCVGFVVNRCARPFNSEALQMLAEGIADVETIDRVLRRGAGFRMGPFELMDLVGVDVSLEIQRSFFAQGFNEPRWRPSEIQAKLVAGGRLGRKSGAGWYSYPREDEARAGPDPPTAADPPPGPVLIAGEGRLAGELRDAAAAAGVESTTDEERAWLAIEADCGTERILGVPAAVSCRSRSLVGRGIDDGSIGFGVAAPFGRCALVELALAPGSDRELAGRTERFFAAIAREVAWVGDAPGLVSGRMLSQLVNEACFTLQRGIATGDGIDTAMRAGMNWPRGPLEWGREIGFATVLETLEQLQAEMGEDRYRPSPLLRRAAIDPESAFSPATMMS